MPEPAKAEAPAIMGEVASPWPSSPPAPPPNLSVQAEELEHAAARIRGRGFPVEAEASLAKAGGLRRKADEAWPLEACVARVVRERGHATARFNHRLQTVKDDLELLEVLRDAEVQPHR